MKLSQMLFTDVKDKQQSSNFITFRCLFISRQGRFHFGSTFFSLNTYVTGRRTMCEFDYFNVYTRCNNVEFF